jgi:hypothetical protein
MRDESVTKGSKMEMTENRIVPFDPRNDNVFVLASQGSCSFRSAISFSY